MANTQILIVEDEEFEAVLVQDALKRLGYGIAGIAVSGEEAVKKAKETRPDLVLMDIVLKGEMDGITAAGLMHKCCDIPVIYLAGLTGDELLQRVELTEPFGYILKPFQERELHAIIEIALYKHRLENRLENAVSLIEKAKKEWEATFDAIKDPIFIHDKEFKIIRANKAYQKMAGMEFQEFIGKPYYEIFPKMDGPFKMCLKALELQAQEEEEEVYSLDKIFKARFFPIKDMAGEYLYSTHVMEDITERRRAEEKIKTETEITTHLLMIAEAIAHTTDMDKLMAQVALCCHRIMACDICLSYLWEYDGKKFRPSHAAGLSNAQMPLFRAEALDETVALVKKALNGKGPVIEQLGVENPFPWLTNIKNIAAIPLLGHKGDLGFIIAIYKKPKEFSERDMKIMTGISGQVSTALEEARLYRESIDRAMELARRIEVIQTMHEIDRSILSTLEPQEILEIASRMVSRVIAADRVTIVNVDREKGGFRYAAGLGAKVLEKLGFVAFDQTSATEILRTGMPEYVPNLKELPGLLLTEKKLLENGFISHVRMPITVKGEVTGILTVGAKRPSAFTADDLSTLEKLVSQISVAMENARLILDLQELFMATVESLSSAIDAKSPWTAGHSARVTKYALDIGNELGFSEKELKDLRLAGLLHDVGKIGTYEAILDKPDKLTDEELKIMRMHPVKGAEILAPIKQLKDIIPPIKYHHEYYDGKGYPEGLKGDAIPLMARILGVADTVDAMSADRPYRKGKSINAIVAELKRCSGAQFDPKVVEAFLNTL